MDNRRDFLKAGLAIGATTALSGVASALPNVPDASAPQATTLPASKYAALADAGYKLIPRVAGYGDLTSPDTANGLPMDVFQKDIQVYSWVTIPVNFAGWRDLTTSYAHDGAVAAILATVSGFQAMISSKQAARSKSVTLNLAAPVPIGQVVQAQARTQQVLSASQMLIAASIFNANNVLLASSTAVWELFSEQQASVICAPADMRAFDSNMAAYFAV